MKIFTYSAILSLPNRTRKYLYADSRRSVQLSVRSVKMIV